MMEEGTWSLSWDFSLEVILSDGYILLDLWRNHFRSCQDIYKKGKWKVPVD